jgi:O-Antigen ligase
VHRGGYLNRSGSALPRWAFVALAGFALALPFELREPLFSVGPIAVTNVELLAYLALGLWALARPRARRTPLHWAALAWTLALLVSAALAPQHGAASLKFAARQIGGVALFCAAADLLSGPGQRLLALSAAYSAAAVLSGLAGLAETAWPGAALALGWFKAQPSLVDGVLRASGTLEYANLAAMSWAMALPMTVALSARGGRWRILYGVGALVLAQALVSSASRAGLLAALLALAGMALGSRGAPRGLRAAAVLGLVALTGLASWAATGHGSLALRLREREDRAWFEAAVQVVEAPALEAGRASTLRLRARNAGRLRWWSAGEHALSIGYAWRDAPGNQVRVAAPLPRDVEPGESLELEATLVAPPTPGRHRLRWLLTGAGVAWLAGNGEGNDLVVEVRPAHEGLVPESPPAAPALALQAQPTRPELWRAGLALWREHPLFGVGPDNFRRLYSRQLGPRALDERVHANSLYVEVLASLGLSGVASLLAVLAAVAVSGARALRASEPGTRLAAAGALWGLAAFWVHGVFDYGLEATPIYGGFWLLAGVLAAGSMAASRAAETRAATASSPAGVR